MIKHIVMFSLKESDKDVEKLERKLFDLKNFIPEIVHIETGRNFSKRKVAYDLVLITEFNSEEDLQTYIDHPEHQKVVEYINEVNEKLAVVDYKF